MVKYQKIFAICGIAAPIIFNMIWILGGILQPGYNHIRDDVSSLLALGAPNKLLFDIMNLINVGLSITFLIGLNLVMRALKGPKVGPILFLVSSILNLIVALFFPLNYGGEPTGITGISHLVIVMITGFLNLGGMIAMWRGLRKVDEWAGYDKYSLISFIGTFIVTILLVFAAGSEIMGIVERLVILANNQYFVVLAIKIYRS
ncbi:MAG: DUF998 domain-containing protein [Promethearchaeota archaeon]|jgi:hypothetical protein